VKVLLTCMEAALESDVPTYAGGLGVLVGDKVRAARDMKEQVDALTFSYPLGYARHRIVDGKVAMETMQYSPQMKFKSHGEMRLKTRFGRVDVQLLRGENAWLVHTDLAKNLYIERTPEDRLKKEIVLGMVGARLAEEGYDVLHVEESHTAFAAEILRKRQPKKRIVFTTHTPLPHGHEVWAAAAIRKLYGGRRQVGMTQLALRNADYVNCVSKMQWEIMNPHLDHRADYITNGVHVSWLHPAISKMLRKNVGDVTRNPAKFTLARALTAGDFREAKAKAKEDLVKEANDKAWHNHEFSGDAFTVGIARRFTGYKRLNMVLRFPEELDRLADEQPLQIVFAGVAHPLDKEGIGMIEQVISTGKRAKFGVAYFPYYTMDLARKMIAGSDLWLNLPYEEREASGTSWMKAMMNGTVLVSTRSGSVPEYADETNALIIPRGSEEEQARSLLAHITAALRNKKLWRTGVKAIASSAPLTAHRMMRDYFKKAYLNG